VPVVVSLNQVEASLVFDELFDELTDTCGAFGYSYTAALACGFNRWMQQFGEIAVPVFRSLVFSVAARSIAALWH